MRLAVFATVSVMILGLASSPASAYVSGNKIYNDGASWTTCTNRYTKIDTWNSAHTGRLQVFGCSNGFFVRASTTYKTGLSAVFTRNNPWYRQEIDSFTGYAVITNMMARRSGWSYSAYSNVVGRTVSWTG
jgi:hypothetical protein